MTLGEKLAQERRRAGKTIKDIERSLRIRGKYIELVEGNKFDELPGSAYAKAFIRSYAKHLGLDPKLFIEEYIHFYEKPKQQESSKQFHIPDINLDFNWRVILVIALSLAILFLTYYSFRPSPGKESETVNTETKVNEVETTEESTVTETLEEDVVDDVDTKELEDLFKNETKETTIKIKSTDEKGCWLVVNVDGEKKYVGMLQEGETKEWKAKESIAITIGNPEGIIFEENGVQINSRDLGMYYEKTIIEEGI